MRPDASVMMTTAALWSTARRSLQSPTVAPSASALFSPRTRADDHRTGRSSSKSAWVGAIVGDELLQQLPAEIIDDHTADGIGRAAAPAACACDAPSRPAPDRLTHAVAPRGGAYDTLILSAAGQPFECGLGAATGGRSAGRDEPVFLAHFDGLGIGAGRRHEHGPLRIIGGLARPFGAELLGIGECVAVISVTAPAMASLPP